MQSDAVLSSMANVSRVDSGDFDLNFLSVPSSQAASIPVPQEFYPLSPEDSFDEALLHPAGRAASPVKGSPQSEPRAAQHATTSAAGGGGQDGNRCKEVGCHF
ncbi:hypothetical protein R1sor_024544 [Riccia sorocarpa]|uniref:Uncharacterized protein n=1 Tax=Riccia sorocarpa TaxID=122646 RepID=A0ABD3GQV2_9MARC